MTLVKLMDNLGLGDQTQTVRIRLGISGDGVITSRNSSGFAEELVVLNKLKAFNDGIAKSVEEDAIQRVTPLCKVLDFDASDDELSEFLNVLSLVIASNKINQLIKDDMSITLIDEILDHYFSIIEVFRSLNNQLQNSRLLSACSFISPLLITISFSFKLKYSRSDDIIKMLTILFSYLLSDEHTLGEITKLFAVNSSTNMDVFEVFNKLWVKTLESIDLKSQLNEKYKPGPISIINRFELLKNEEISLDLINQILPFNTNSFLLKTSRDIVFLQSQLSLLKDDSLRIEDVATVLFDLLSYLSTDSGVELVLLLISSLKLDERFLDFYEIDRLKPTVHYFFFQFSNVLNLKTFKDRLNYKFVAEILSTDIVEVIDSSLFARYKVLFEVIDHNYKTDFIQDFQLSLALEHSLLAINRDFDLSKEHFALTELGSSFSIEAIINYVSFILQGSLVRLVNPISEIPAKFTDIMQLNKLPPLPRSEFLDFKIEDISKIQSNLKNFNKLINSIHLSTRLIERVFEAELTSKSALKLIDGVNGEDMNLSFVATDALLQQYFTVLYTNLILATELISKSKVDGKSSSVFYDFESVGNILKLQTFKSLESLFKLYGTFAFYRFVNFITSVSYTNLELQKFSLVFLDHIVFHSKDSESMKTVILSNEFIKKSLTEFISEWNDGVTLIYEAFSKLLGLESQQSNVIFEFRPYLKQLGFNEPEPVPIISPAPSSSTSSVSNFNMTNNYSSGNTTALTPTYSSQGNYNNYGHQNNQSGNTHSGLNNNFTQSNYSQNYNQSLNLSRNQSSDNNVSFNQLNANYNYNSNTPTTNNTTTINNNNSSFNQRTNNIRNVQSFIPQQQQHQSQQQQQQQKQLYNQNKIQNYSGLNNISQLYNIDQLYGK